MNIRIPQHLDEPERYFIFTPDELVVVVVPLTVVTVLSNFLIGMVVGGAGFWILRRIKKGGRLHCVLWAAYWLLPSRIFGLKATPASDARLLAG